MFFYPQNFSVEVMRLASRGIFSGKNYTFGQELDLRFWRGKLAGVDFVREVVQLVGAITKRLVRRMAAAAQAN